MRDPQRGLTHDSETSHWRRLGDEVARLASAVGLERSARLVAVALVPVFLEAQSATRVVPVYTALILYVLVTSFATRNRFLRAADIAVAAALIVATGGESLPFLLFLMVTVAGPAARGGIVAGLAAGGTLSVVLLATLVTMQRLDDLAVAELVPIVLLLPLTGISMGAAAQVYANQDVRDRRMLQEANRLLSALRAIADDLPGGLDVTTVAAALVAEVRGIEGTRAAIVYAFADGVLKPVASNGVARGELPTLRVDQLRRIASPGRTRLSSLSSLPTELGPACDDHRWWAVTGMHRGEDLVGILLVGVDDPDRARRARPHLGALAEDGAIALQNAQLFDGTRERAAQAARRHLAGDLHDGAAQALAHLRMELELLAMDPTDPATDEELRRLAGVSRAALDDLRATIAGLRQPGHEDLVEAIRRHIDYSTKRDGPELEFRHLGDPDVPAPVGDELLRVVQEGLSNALRHARATHVRVTLEADTELLRLVIEDDGTGMTGPTTQAGGGVGLRSMRERADRLGARLTIGPRAGGGTAVELEWPLPATGNAPMPTTREPADRAPTGPENRSDPSPSTQPVEGPTIWS